MVKPAQIPKIPPSDAAPSLDAATATDSIGEVNQSQNQPNRRATLTVAATLFATSSLPILSSLGFTPEQPLIRNTPLGFDPVEIITIPKNNDAVSAPHGGAEVQDLLDHWPTPRAGAEAHSARATIDRFRSANYLPTNHAHELVHAFQELVRHQYAVGTQFERSVKVSDSRLLNVAAVYFGQGRVAFVPCAENVSLRDLARFLPRSLSDNHLFDMYIRDPARLSPEGMQSFSAEMRLPYLLDELSCRHLGAVMSFGLIQANTRFNSVRTTGPLYYNPGLEQLVLFALGACVLSAQSSVTFSQSGDRAQFLSAVRCLVERSLWLNSKIAKSAEMLPILTSNYQPGQFLRIFAQSSDCTQFREQVKQIFGQELFELLSADPTTDWAEPISHFKDRSITNLASSGEK